MRRPLLPGLLLTLLLGTAVAGPAATSATTPAGFGSVPPPVTTGVVGPWSLKDTQTSPSVACLYDVGGPITTAKTATIRAPKVRWPDRRPVGGERGRVRWRVTIEMTSDNGVTWQPAGITRVRTATATEGTRAPFTTQQLSLVALPDKIWYRVRHTIVWLRPDGTKLGSVQRWAEWYAPPAPGSSLVGGCPGVLL